MTRERDKCEKIYSLIQCKNCNADLDLYTVFPWVVAQNIPLRLKSWLPSNNGKNRMNAVNGKGIIVRREQNHRAYRALHGRKAAPSLTTSTVTESISSAIRALAAFPLPTSSSLFNEAARSADALDESDFLTIWDAPPPYTSAPPPDTFRERAYTENLANVMHGRRLRQQREGRQRRMTSLQVRGRAAVREEVAGMLEDALQSWATLRAGLEAVSDCERHVQMAELNLRWQARLICGWQDELNYFDGKTCEIDTL
ncbi:hypothetical protein PLICRDRAFT_28662 [Plicaturopsis crispa FD-325 SS-3]|nr:hypothetical protein PLICRDRAFT_28662 [Plicaturopsis crispa FD-325 SS-3]